MNTSRQMKSQLNFKFLTHPPFNSTQNSSLPHQSLSSILHGLRESKPVQQIHARIVTCGLSHNIFLSNRLMNSYASSGQLPDAEKIFYGIVNKNIVSWTILISGFTKNDLHIEAISVFRQMMMISGLRPNAVTIASVLPAFGKLGLSSTGKSIHCYWIRQSYGSNVFVETAMIDMYSKLGRMDFARNLFDEMPVRNSVSWNAIISGYSDNEFHEEAVWLFNLMRRKGFLVDFFTMVSFISSCSTSDLGLGIHGFAVRTGFGNDQYVKTGLIEMYVTGNSIDDAYYLFDEMPVKDMVAWTLMLKGFSSSPYWKKAIQHFNIMMGIQELSIDHIALTSILSSCTQSGSLQQGKRIHGLVIKLGFECDFFVGSSIIDMYSNCSNLENARKFFDWMEEKDVACWNAMISGNGMNGHCEEALDLFFWMKEKNIIPNESTLVCVLSACSHGCRVKQGLQVFYHMIKTCSLVPNLKHYACVVDLLGRAGRVHDAYSMIKNMKKNPNFEVYAALLSACKVYKNVDLGCEISHKLLELKPNDAGHYILLSDVYALAGNWEAAKFSRVSMRLKGLKKEPGLSSIEMNREIYTFLAGEKDHPRFMEIDDLLTSMMLEIGPGNG